MKISKKKLFEIVKECFEADVRNKLKIKIIRNELCGMTHYLGVEIEHIDIPFVVKLPKLFPLKLLSVYFGYSFNTVRYEIEGFKIKTNLNIRIMR